MSKRDIDTNDLINEFFGQDDESNQSEAIAQKSVQDIEQISEQLHTQKNELLNEGMKEEIKERRKKSRKYDSFLSWYKETKIQELEEGREENFERFSVNLHTKKKELLDALRSDRRNRGIKATFSDLINYAVYKTYIEK